jgi:hypothetical protein
MEIEISKHCPHCYCAGVKRGPRGKYGSKFLTEEERMESIKESQRRHRQRKKIENSIHGNSDALDHIREFIDEAIGEYGEKAKGTELYSAFKQYTQNNQYACALTIKDFYKALRNNGCQQYKEHNAVSFKLEY